MKKTDFNFDITKVEQVFYSNLREKDKRLFAGLEAMKIGYYGVDEVSTKYKIHKHTVRKGQKELVSENLVPADSIRRKGGGRKKNSKHFEYCSNILGCLVKLYCWQSDEFSCFMDKFDL